MTNWDAEISSLLGRLTTAQRELLSLLKAKRELIRNRDHAALTELADREQQLADQLQACHRDRAELLRRAQDEGLPDASLADLNAAAGDPAGLRSGQIDESRRRAKLIRHECLSQWVAVQRSVLHLSQMLEIIATGGRPQPTYGNSGGGNSGSLMDQAV